MDFIDTPPLRRGGEENCTGHGRDWGENSHILPGRRVGEPNHRALDNRLLLPLDLSSEHEKPDTRTDRITFERLERPPGKVSVGCRDTLRSLARVIQVLEWMRSKRNDNGDHVPQSASWSAEVIEQIQTMWGYDWVPMLDHGNVPKTYGRCIRPQNENVRQVHHFNKT